MDDPEVMGAGVKGRYCAGKTVRGADCHAYALRDSDLCITHDQRPEIVELRGEMAKTAGMSQKVLFPEVIDPNAAPLPVKPINIKRARDLKKAIVRTLQEVRYGTIDPDLARTLLYGFNVLVNAIDKIEIVKRIEELERAAQAKGLVLGPKD